ncbi:MAG: xanthine dehydrogenase family protein molybdopterin-binding subunit, partial [Cytophagaceae bacterium]|nr:xanthine dehydrogenase family protein molybdopterin-binding subunit [Gemmatimonadaceae bacterium]
MTDAPRDKRFITTEVEVEGRFETKIVELPPREPEPWGPDAELHIVGQSLPRVDAFEKVTGRAIFTADVTRPGMLHAAFVRAPITAGRVTLDISAALQVPGVIEVLQAEDLPRPMKAGGVGLLSRDVSYPGQPVAAVCADTA